MATKAKTTKKTTKKTRALAANAVPDLVAAAMADGINLEELMEYITSTWLARQRNAGGR